MILLFENGIIVKESGFHERTGVIKSYGTTY